jgi:hypothetical protein
MSVAAVCLLAGLTAASAQGQTVTLNRGLAFGNVLPPLASVTVPGVTPPDARAAWLTLVLGAGRKNCRGTVLITVPATITRTSAPAVTIATSPFVATLVNPDATTSNVPIGASTQLNFSGTHQLYVGTTGAFSFARAGTYSGTFTVTLTKGAGC